jgi:hypothetical protein
MSKEFKQSTCWKRFINLLKNIKLKRVFPHLTIIIAVMFVAMLITDFFNNAIQLLVGPYFKTLLLLLCVFSITTSVIFIVQNWDK